MATPLLPGERIEAELRIAPTAVLGRDLAACAYLALGGLLWLLFHSATWLNGSQGAGWKFWNYLVGNDIAADAWAFSLLVAIGAAWSLLARQRAPAIVGVASGVAAVLVSHSALDGPVHEESLAVSVALLVAPALLVIELDRLLRRVRLTNLRVVADGGFLQPVVAILHEEVRDVVAHADTLGPLSKSGRLEFTLAKSATPGAETRVVSVRNVRPLVAVRDAVLAIIQHSTATPSMQEDGSLARRKTDAVAKATSR